MVSASKAARLAKRGDTGETKKKTTRKDAKGTTEETAADGDGTAAEE